MSYNVSIFDSNMYLLMLHIQNSIVQNKYYFNITVASQIFAKYIIFKFFFCFSVWNHIVCFEWLGKNWRQGYNIKVAFLSHLYLSSVVNQCYRFFKNTKKKCLLGLCKTRSIRIKIKARQKLSTTSYVLRLNKVLNISIK